MTQPDQALSDRAIGGEVSRLEVMDNLYSAEIFADNAISFGQLNGVVRVVLTSTRSLQMAAGPGASSHVVVGRLSMPIPSAQALVVGLNDFLEQQGLSPSKAVRQDTPTQ